MVQVIIFVLQHSWWFIGGFIAIGLIVMLWLMKKGKIPSFREMGGNSDKFIPVKIFSEDKVIRDKREKVGRYCVQDEKKRIGWFLVNLIALKGASSGKRFLCVSERDDFPIDFHGKLTSEEKAKYGDARRVFLDATADIRSQASKQAATNLMATSLSIIALMAGLVVVVIGIVTYYRSHKAVTASEITGILMLATPLLQRIFSPKQEEQPLELGKINWNSPVIKTKGPNITRECIVICNGIWYENQKIVALKGTDFTDCEWTYNGRLYPVLVDNGDGLEHYNHSEIIGESPARLYKAANPEGFKGAFKHRSTMLQKVQIGLMALIAIGILFMLYMMVQGK